MEGNTYPAEPHRLPQSGLWYGFSAAPIAWALEGFLGVVISAQYCPPGVPNWGVLGEWGVRLALGLITVGLLGVAASSGVVAFRNWRRLAEQRELIHDEALSREDFMALGGILISAVFAVGILWSGIPLIMLHECMRAH